MKIYDSVLKSKVDFIPIQKGRVKMYLCGPTVYDDAHLGHARSAITFDMLRRTLQASGYAVEMMRNFTDIDDKIINKAKTTGESIESITARYTDSYLQDMGSMNVLRPDFEPKATENLQPMVELIEELLHKGYAYKTPKGDIYMDVGKDEKYGTLSGRIEDEDAQSRIENDTSKKNPRDFALWKIFKEKDEVGYDTALGRGRPGWHTECCAMIDNGFAYKGEYAIDIHAGGADLLFPHHENEAAQTRCAKNQILSKYWIHNGFVTIDGEKMSKSLGNSFFVKDALQHYHGEVLRFYLLSTHYSSPLHFNEEDLLASKKRLDKLYRLKKRLYGGAASALNKDFQASVLESMQDDMNVSKALSYVDEMINNANVALDNNTADKGFKKETVANLDFIAMLFGVGGGDAYSYFQFGIDETTKSKIETLIEERNAAKKAKDYAKADAIRDELTAMEIKLSDTPEGTVWEKN